MVCLPEMKGRLKKEGGGGAPLGLEQMPKQARSREHSVNQATRNSTT